MAGKSSIKHQTLPAQEQTDKNSSTFPALSHLKANTAANNISGQNNIAPETMLPEVIAIEDEFIKNVQNNLQETDYPNQNAISRHNGTADNAENNGSLSVKPPVVEGVIEKGDTISKILEDAAEGKVQHYINAAQKVFSPGAFKTGQPYIVITDPESGKVKRFEYEINSSKKLVVEGDENPSARLEKIEYFTFLAIIECTITDNLFQAVADIGESPQLALKIADLFGSEINFIRDLQEGDNFSVLIEKRYKKGEYKGYGRILAAKFTNQGNTYEAFLFSGNSGQNSYYNAKGENLRKTLLQAPLAITRLTSKFSQNRKHPVFGISKPHLGVDYGAPAGTPVKAVGDGTVISRGWAGGYGNQIIIRHSAGLESQYAHLSGFASGLKKGGKVRQGQIIGFVGSTGISTGPHLDFRLKQNNKFINPAKAVNPRENPVMPVNMAAFNQIVKKERDMLNSGSLPENYTLDSIVPSDISLSKGSLTEKKTENSKAYKKGKKRS